MDDLTTIKGIGPKTKEKLNRAGIQTINDLLFLFPSRYETQRLDSEEAIEIGKVLTLEVVVAKRPKVYFIRKNLDKLSVEVNIGHRHFQVHIFNRRFLSQALSVGQVIVITGQFIQGLSHFTASQMVLRKNFVEGIHPLYHVADVKDANIRKMIQTLLEETHHLEDPIPADYLDKHQIPNINELLKKIHQPKDETDILVSRKRIVYEELLEFALRIEYLKRLNEAFITEAKHYDIETVRAFIRTLPFELTDDQKQATNEIFKDLKRSRQMNRLLQGDVGSGKTIIAIIATLAVVTAGCQVAIMAPTLVLAHQHLTTFRQYLKTYDIDICLLTSDLSASERRAVIDDIRQNKAKIIIGTHSLIQEDVDFHNLGFLVIDEQHRFGVAQRKELRQKGAVPDILLMSATPIPRTLAISIYKDIDISFIREKPSGRKDVLTRLVAYTQLDRMLGAVTKELDKGHQAYVICPKIAESETSNKISVEEMYALLRQKLGQRYDMAILHGRMSDEQKTDVLNRFYAGHIKILISTTVVEVGVNVKNATVMVIMNANSFGLAQLHQLRGRIGRDSHQSYCYLVEDDLAEAKERLNIMQETNDGFLISEYDLSMRGPGEVFGRTQSGIPEFRMANLIKDTKILEEALADAAEIITREDEASKNLVNHAIKAIESYHLD